MYYVLTIHPTEHWIETQKRYFERYLPTDDVSTLAIVPDPANGHSPFEETWPDQGHTGSGSINHQINLNYLTQRLLEKDPADDDLMIVFDGDAWPVARIEKPLEWLKLVPVVSIENSGKRPPIDKRVHCSFIAMRIGFWRELGVTWDRGGGFRQVNDTNGALMAAMMRRKLKWKSLPRSNTVEPFFPLFGIYGESIYHHGAGFRPPSNTSARERKIIRAVWGDEKSETGNRQLGGWKITLWSAMRERILEDESFFQKLLS